MLINLNNVDEVYESNRKVYEQMFHDDDMSDFIINETFNWHHYIDVVNAYLFFDDKHMNTIELDDWQALADKCWGKLPSALGTYTEDDRVAMLKECMRIHAENFMIRVMQTCEIVCKNDAAYSVVAFLLSQSSYELLIEVSKLIGLKPIPDNGK